MSAVTTPTRDRAAADERTDGVRAPRRGRVHRIAVAVLMGLTVAFVGAVVMGAGLDAEPGTGPRLGGDFPAFYGAGSIVWDGDLDRLYDADRQQQAQEGLGVDGYLAFAYPPHVALGYAPFGALDFRVSYALHSLLTTAALVLALGLLRPVVPALKNHFVPVVAAAITFFPLFTALGGGQNTGFTVLAFAAVWRALDDDQEVVAGLVIGLLLYRPQYALPLGGLVLLRGHGLATVTAATTALITWAGTSVIMGRSWLVEWLDQVRPFIERDAEVNAANSISVLGFLHALFGTEDTLVNVVGFVGAGAVVAILMRLWWRGHVPLAQGIGAAAAGVLLISPHTMFYDAGLLVIAVLAVAAPGTEAAQRFALLLGVAVWLTAWVHLSNDALGATPLILVVASVFAISVRPDLSTRLAR